MTYYIAMMHKDEESCYGVSFPDFPGQITAASSLDDAAARAQSLLAFIAESWEQSDGSFPQPRTIDELRHDATFLEDSANAILIAVPLQHPASRPAAA